MDFPGTRGLSKNPSGDGKDAVFVNGKQQYEIHSPYSLYREVYWADDWGFSGLVPYLGATKSGVFPDGRMHLG